MKTLMLAALLFLAASGWVGARGTPPEAPWTQDERPEASAVSAAQVPVAEPSAGEAPGGAAAAGEALAADASAGADSGSGADLGSGADSGEAVGSEANAKADAHTSADANVPTPVLAGDPPAPGTQDEQAASEWADTAWQDEGAGESVAEADEAASGIQPSATDAGTAAADSLMMDVGEVLDELLWPEPYAYQSGGTRDPFAPLVGGQEAVNEGPIAIGDMVVVGVLWSESDRFALIETRGGRNVVLRAGDRVQDGRVIEVLPDGLRVSHTLYGITRVITLPVRSGLEGKDER
jgi:hypothetical protein